MTTLNRTTRRTCSNTSSIRAMTNFSPFSRQKAATTAVRPCSGRMGQTAGLQAASLASPQRQSRNRQCRVGFTGRRLHLRLLQETHRAQENKSRPAARNDQNAPSNGQKSLRLSAITRYRRNFMRPQFFRTPRSPFARSS